jgi:hypothetical protein
MVNSKGGHRVVPGSAPVPRRSSRLLLFTISNLLLLTLAACTSQDLKSTDIVSQIPWSGPAGVSDSYRVLDDDETEVGTLEMTIQAAGPDLTTGEVILGQFFDFPDKGFTNEASVVADAQTLQPISTRFQIIGPEGDLTCTAEYEDSQVTVERVGEDDTRTDTLDVPAISYDSWSDLFLWRTIEFTEGYSVEYTDILSCTLDRTQKLGVTLTVKEREEITVPAGDFDTWRLEIDSGGGTQTAWYTADDAHRLVRYDNGREVFELTDVHQAGQ